MFQLGLALFALGSLLCSVAPGLGWLVAFRGLQAIGGSMLNPVAMSIIVNTFTEPKERARAVGVWGSVSGLSLSIGPVVGGILVSGIGWRSIFWINVPIGIAAILLTQRYVPESKAPRARRLDPPAQGLVAVEWRRQDPLIDIRFFRSAPFSGATVIAVAAFATLGGFLFLNTLYLQDARGYSPLDASLLTIPMATMIGVFANVSGRLVGGRGPRLPLILAGPLLAAGSLLLARLSPHTAVAYLVAAYIVFGMGSGLVMAPITTAAVSGMPIAQAGVAGALASTSRQIGSALGVAVTGSIVAGGVGAGFVTSSQAAWVVMAGCGVAVLVVGLVSTGHWALGTARRNGQRLALGLKGGPIRAEEAIPLGRGARR